MSMCTTCMQQGRAAPRQKRAEPGDRHKQGRGRAQTRVIKRHIAVYIGIQAQQTWWTTANMHHAQHLQNDEGDVQYVEAAA